MDKPTEDPPPEGIPPKTVAKIREQVDDRFTRGNTTHVEPLARKVPDQRFGTRVGQHARDLLFEHVALMQAVRRAERDQFLVRDAAPQKER